MYNNRIGIFSYFLHCSIVIEYKLEINQYNHVIAIMRLLLGSRAVRQSWCRAKKLSLAVIFVVNNSWIFIFVGRSIQHCSGQCTNMTFLNSTLTICITITVYVVYGNFGKYGGARMITVYSNELLTIKKCRIMTQYSDISRQS